MTYREALKKLTEELTTAAIPDPATDAGLLLHYVTGYDRIKLLMDGAKEIGEAELDKINELSIRRQKHEPLQYILGTQCFMGLDFMCAPGCLIPRYDTEILVEQVMSIIDGYKESPKVLDVCTGSGCIIISLEKLKGLKTAVGCDISDSALSVAESNKAANKSSVTLVKSDLFEEIKGRFDIIVSNPPYIRSDEIPGLMPEVSEYEPLLALDGGKDGLYFYRRITEAAKFHLEPEGWLAFEIGEDQGTEVTCLMQAQGFKDIKTVKDLAGLDRVVLAHI